MSQLCSASLTPGSHLAKVLLQVSEDGSVAAAPQHKGLGLAPLGWVLCIGQMRSLLPLHFQRAVQRLTNRA